MSVEVLDGIMGLVVGDAFGVPYEFMAREKVKELFLKRWQGQVFIISRWALGQLSFIACDIYVYLGILLLNGHVLDTACEKAAWQVFIMDMRRFRIDGFETGGIRNILYSYAQNGKISKSRIL
ncbi:MAG: ADP-ribosylglycohydrolase family protein [Lachnospiraceae bacterium]|nr:ADP-ribosylglycohydrolase family protein [Lachnospiraceae bacterium]